LVLLPSQKYPKAPPAVGAHPTITACIYPTCTACRLIFLYIYCSYKNYGKAPAMVLQKNDWAWIRIRNNRRLGLVLAVREHVAVVRPLFKSRKQLQPYRETIALRLLEKADLSREEIAMLPCGKRILSVNKAFEIVAANRIFTDDPKRKERRVYYCSRCRGFHTSSKVPVPWILFAR